MKIDWDDIGTTLVNDYFANESTIRAKYFNYFDVTEDDPLAAVVPLVGMDKFFGTVVQNILIIAKPYGWNNVDTGSSGGTYSWPPDGFEDSKARLIASYKYFAKYETLVWMDFSVENADCTSGDVGTFLTEMATTEVDIIAMCNDLADYGFTYMGRLNGSEDAEFFKTYITPHFAQAVS